MDRKLNNNAGKKLNNPATGSDDKKPECEPGLADAKPIVLNELSLVAAAAFAGPAGCAVSCRSDDTPTLTASLTAIPTEDATWVERSAEDRDTLIGKLMGPLWGLAWRVSEHNHDLAEELRAYVLLKCLCGRYNPKKGQFAAWARTVMTRRLISLVGAKGRGVGGEDNEVDCEDYREDDVAAGDTHTSPFPAADLKRILKWRPVKRALLLSRSQLWRKLPPGVWDQTLADVGLPASFPGEGFDDLCLADQNTALAEAFGVPLNTIHVRWGRWVELLQALSFVQGLRPRD